MRQIDTDISCELDHHASLRFPYPDGLPAEGGSWLEHFEKNAKAQMPPEMAKKFEDHVSSGKPMMGYTMGPVYKDHEQWNDYFAVNLDHKDGSFRGIRVDLYGSLNPSREVIFTLFRHVFNVIGEHLQPMISNATVELYDETLTEVDESNS